MKRTAIVILVVALMAGIGWLLWTAVVARLGL